MNILSFLSVMVASALFIGGFYCLTRNRKSKLNLFSFLVLLLLGWWSFCNAFFFSAETEISAWEWHHLASIGWTGFIAETTYYFIVLTGIDKKFKKIWTKIAFYILPVTLLLHNLFADKTSLAIDLCKSRIWNQWAYVNSADNVWLWLYIICLFVYFAFSFVLLINWAIKVKHRMKKIMAVCFVALDAITILLGFVTDVLSPLTNQFMPAIANICTSVFGAGYFLIIVRFDLFNVRHVVEDSVIIEKTMEALMVIDEEGEILDANSACARLLNYQREKLIGERLAAFFDNNIFELLILKPLKAYDVVNSAEISLIKPDGEKKQLIISGSVIRDRKHEYMGTVLSIRDITQLKVLNELYKKQSEQYQKLALVDTLTGLPNRRKTFEYLKECENEYIESGKDFFVFYMDLNNFKSINDNYGHNIGDQFLKMVADRLNLCIFGELTFLSRLSGDEFFILGIPKTEKTEKTDYQTYVQCIIEQFQPPFVLGEENIHCSISIGYAKYSEHKNIDDMMHHADEQMYRMKENSKKDN